MCAQNRKKVRVLIVDDSALVRNVLKKGLEGDPDITVVGVASDPYAGRDLLVKLRPDVLTLDVEMPKMDGVTFLKKIMGQLPTPVVMVSSLTGRGKAITIEALEAGAVDIIEKPSGLVDGLPKMMADIRQRVKAAAQARVVKRAPTRTASAGRPAVVDVARRALVNSTDKVIAIGSSAGGVEALARVLPMFPPASPGIVLCQHMPAGFTASFAERLDALSHVEVREAKDGDRVRAGLALLAPGGARHMRIRRSGGEYRVVLSEGDLIAGHRPAVDALMESVAKEAGSNAAGAILTGMGRDGAQGLLAMRNAGAHTFSQNEQTSVIYGMPRAAWENGGSEKQVPLDRVPQSLLGAVTTLRSVAPPRPGTSAA